MSKVMMTCIPNGPHYDRRETKQCQISQIYSIPCVPSWVSKSQSDIWCSRIAVIFIDTSRQKWNLWTYSPWVWPINMSSKSSKISNKGWENLGLGTPHNKSQKRAAPTYRTKDRENMDNIRKTIPSHMQRRTLKVQRRILGSGTTSLRSLGITQFISDQRSSCWIKWKPLNQMQVLTLSQN